MIISIDLSLRSTGAIALDDDKNLLAYALVKSSNKPVKNKKWLKVANEEELITYNSEEIIGFINTISREHALDAIIIEGLSFGAVSGNKDILYGNYWHLRVQLKKNFLGVPIHIIPVQSWRNKILSKTDREIAKGLYGKKWQKQGVVEKLPKRKVREKFEEYIKVCGYCKDSVFDLADAYSMGCYFIDYVME